MQRIEIQHHSPEQIAGYVKDAIELSQAEGVPDALREAVFVQSVQLLASKTVQAVAHPQGLLTPGLP